MFKRKQKELTAEDAPDSIVPWEMLDETEIEVQTARLRERWPGRNLVAIARRLDTDAVACFDKGPDGAGKAVLVVSNLDAADGATEQHYPGFGAWFDAALADAQEYEASRADKRSGPGGAGAGLGAGRTGRGGPGGHAPGFRASERHV